MALPPSTRSASRVPLPGAPVRITYDPLTSPDMVTRWVRLARAAHPAWDNPRKTARRLSEKDADGIVNWVHTYDVGSRNQPIDSPVLDDLGYGWDDEGEPTRTQPLMPRSVSPRRPLPPDSTMSDDVEDDDGRRITRRGRPPTVGPRQRVRRGRLIDDETARTLADLYDEDPTATYADLADIVGTSLHTVRSAILRARNNDERQTT